MWDLTYTITEDMLLYPGIPQPVLHDFATAENDGYGLSNYAFWNHLGTHIDAPTHFFADGLSLDQFPIDAFIRRVHTIHCEGEDSISASFLSHAVHGIPPTDGLLLLTGQYRYWGTPRYFDPFPVLTKEGAEYLMGEDYSMILVDAPSVDPVTTDTFPIHRIVLQHPVLIVENLAYQEDLPDSFHVTALPIKVRNSNGCPARIIATR